VKSTDSTSPVKDLLPLENVLPEDVARRQGHDIILFDELGGQGAFSSPGFPKHDHPEHLPVPSGLSRFILSPRGVEEQATRGNGRGVDPPSLNTAEQQCLDDHCRGDISMGEGEEGRGRTVGERRVSPLELIYIRGTVDGDWGTELDKMR
jgi:hypothetical protein